MSENKYNERIKSIVAELTALGKDMSNDPDKRAVVEAERRLTFHVKTPLSSIELAGYQAGIATRAPGYEM